VASWIVVHGVVDVVTVWQGYPKTNWCQKPVDQKLHILWASVLTRGHSNKYSSKMMWHISSKMDGNLFKGAPHMQSGRQLSDWKEKNKRQNAL
jgi:hypothetical protein